MDRYNRHALVTGGGSGIGLACAEALNAAGWRVTLAGRNRQRLEATAQALAGSHVEAMDVTNAGSVETAIASAVGRLGPISVLVNNAGIAPSAPFEKTDIAMWQATLDVNLMGAVRCARAALPSMTAQRFGRIVNIASTAGLVGYRFVTAYVAAKHAVVGFTKALALEVAKSGVTVNAVCPGYTDTQIVADAVRTIVDKGKRTASEALAGLTATNPQGRLVLPKEVASAVVWLSTDEAAAVNGIALPIAGGEVA